MKKALKRTLALFMVFAVVVTMSPFFNRSMQASADSTSSEDMLYLCAWTYSSGIKLTIEILDETEDFYYVKIYVKKPGSSNYTYLTKKDCLESDYYDYYDPYDYYEFIYKYKTDVKGQYKFKLVAYDWDDHMMESDIITYTYAKLSTPKVTTKTLGSSKVKISWNKVDGAKGYKVYRATSKYGNYKLVKTVTSGSTLSYINKTPSKNKKYYYTVRAFTKVDENTAYSNYSDIKVGIAGVLKTSIKSITSYSGKVVLKWKKNSKATGYMIYRSTSKDGKYTWIKTITKETTTSYTDKDVKAGTTYYYKVKTYKIVNGNKFYGNMSKIRSKKVTTLSYTYVKAKAAYRALKNDCVYYPDTLKINHIYSGTINGKKVIMIDESAENSYGVRGRGYFTYWMDGYWSTDTYDLTDLNNKKELNKSKVLN